jgi:hypothetical protein
MWRRRVFCCELAIWQPGEDVYSRRLSERISRSDAALEGEENETDVWRVSADDKISILIVILVGIALLISMMFY